MSGPLKLNKGQLDKFVAALLARYRLFGPVKAGGLVRFAEVESAEALDLDSSNTTESAKGVFFPQAETLLVYEDGKTEDPARPVKPIAVFGIRPCDARGLAMLDKVFGTGKYKDSCWVRRYQDALVISLGCSSPQAGCFCNWLGSSPFDNQGSDIACTDTGDVLVLEPCSEKGRGFLENSDGIPFEKPSEDDLSKVAEIRNRVGSSMEEKSDISSIKATLDKSWESPLWDELAGKCLSCAACAYLCPTCHCFDIQDENVPGASRGRRIRIWDSCMATQFTKEASGHNPRPTGKERLRQRVMHKFNYFVDVYGEMACVGCGRCIRSCPVNIDIRAVIKRFIDAG